MPIKNTEFLVKYRQNTHKNTDTQEGEFQQYCESCKKKLYNWRVKTAVDGWMDGWMLTTVYCTILFTCSKF